MSDKIHNTQKNKKNVYDIQGGEKKFMKKSTKKVINVAASAALLAGIAPVAGVVAPTAAHASGSFDVLNVPTYGTSNQGPINLGTVRVNVDKSTLRNPDATSTTGDTYRLTATLPQGFNFDITGNKAEDIANAQERIYGQEKFQPGANNSNPENNIGVSVVDVTSKSVVFGFKGRNLSDDISFLFNLDGIESEGANTGDVNLTFSADPNSGLPVGNVKVATIVGSNQVALEASETRSSSDNFDFTLKVTESVKGSLRAGNAVRIKLPSGFKWNAPSATGFTSLYGSLQYNGLSFSGENTDTLTIAKTTTAAEDKNITASSFNQVLSFTVDDEDVAKEGDITATITGNTSTNVSNLVVGSYGQYGGGVTIANPTQIWAGKDEQQVGDIVIKEAVAGSFVYGRTVTLQLPEGAQWQTAFEGKKEGISASVETANGMINPTKVEYTGTDNRTMRLTFGTAAEADQVRGGTINSSNRAGSLTLKNVEVATRPGFSGDLNLTVAGSQGLTGTVKAATVTPSITLTATNATYNTSIGEGAVATGDIVLKEAVAGALTRSNNSDGRVSIELPWGVTFANTPTVTVTSGDLRINNVSSEVYQGSNNGRLSFTVQNESATASTITLSNVNLRVDRSVPQGPILAKVTGQAAAFTAYGIDGNKPPQSWTDTYRYAAQAEVANVGTAPAGATENEVEAVYTIGSTAYTVNGETRTAEVAPYIENGRTYLPVRYVAEALGVTPANILFDKPTSMVTLIKGDRVVQMKLNTNQLTINGTTINMDVKAVTKSNRTVLPIAWVGKALDAVVQYDAAARTVTVNSK